MGVSFTVKIDHADPWVTYRAPSAGLGFDVQPEVAMAYFANKGLKPTFSWMDMLGEAHDQAFTVAKMMDVDLLAEVRAQVDAALANGTTLADFKKTLIPKLQAAGWWGKHDVVDPLTGKVVKAQLGSARRLELIFRTNLQVAYSAGHWANAQATKAACRTCSTTRWTTAEPAWSTRSSMARCYPSIRPFGEPTTRPTDTTAGAALSK